MSEPIRKPDPPNSVPEEDLSLHENFAPAIAENGRIRQLPPEEVPANAFAWMDDPSTRFDIVQDLVEIRRAEKKEAQARLAEQTPAPAPAQSDKQPLQQEIQPQGLALQTGEDTPAVQPEIAPLPQTITQPQTAAQPEETDLPSVPVLSPALETQTAEKSIFGKTRRRKKKKQKTLRMPVISALEETPAEKQNESSVAGVPPQTPSDPKPTRPKRRRWGWVLALLLLGFFITIGGVVPVENIPILRHIAYAMGFDQNTTRQISFLRALLAWTDKSLGLNGKLSVWPSGDTLLAQGMKGVGGTDEENGAKFESGWQASLERASGTTRLIDIRALNALQREQGRALDSISGTIVSEPGREDETLPAVLRDDQVTARTEANIDKGEVFFGSDNSAVNRHFEDGYDSSKMLAKIKNPYITDGNPIDWTQRMAWQLMSAGSGLVGANKELQYGAASWQVTPQNIGNTKPHKDLYHAWITSRMSKYTTNIWLKKSLADSSFLNAEIPTTASTGLKIGGVTIDSDSLQEDQEAWKAYLEYEENCRKELKNGGGKEVGEAIDDFNNLFSRWPGSGAPNNFGFPEKCEEVTGPGVDQTQVTKREDKYKANLNAILEQCKKANKGYDKLYTSCNMRVTRGECSPHDIQNFSQRWDEFVTACKIPNTCDQLVDEAAKAACIAVWERNRQEAEAKAAKTEVDLIAKVGGATAYFPQMVREDAIDAQENITAWTEESKDNVDNTLTLWMNENKANF